MSEPAPFSFKAARPASKTQIVQEAMKIEAEREPSNALQQVQAADGVEAPRRRRRPNKVQEEGDDLTIFLDIVTRLQSLTPAARKKIVAALGRVFA